MGIRGCLVAKEVLQIDLTCSRRKEVASSDYLCDSHVCVIHGNCQLIRNYVVAALNKKITARTGKIFSVGSIYQVGEGNKRCGIV